MLDAARHSNSAKLSVFNLLSIYQAGRRGFESRLSFHFFNKLTNSDIPVVPFKGLTLSDRGLCSFLFWFFERIRSRQADCRE